jgi:hypothetical protein
VFALNDAFNALRILPTISSQNGKFLPALNNLLLTTSCPPEVFAFSW